VDPRVTFFPKRQVRLELSGWSPKMNNEGEKRIRLDFMLPLIDDARDGIIPAWVLPSLPSMEKEDSVQTETKLDITLEGITAEFFDTPKSPGRTLLLTAATFQDFHLRRVTRDKHTFLALTFTANVKRDWSQLRWCDKYEDCWVWSEFTPTDPAMPSKPVPGEQMTIADADKPEQTPEEAKANVESFLKKAQKDVKAQPIEEQAQELATVGKKDHPKRPRGFDPKGAA
jgi:hypothetical protein